ncbi:hypothetical protein [Streptomyces sp. SPB4]|uniref:hypothetical protein n=1 Tax=Streptomyces sp. SPB4 TaxID=2940553 RepID=UPI002473BA31|nr:hypothetical protein [Streptomyces sp. SPB4]MDH6539743.1 hypothetical protein [Streptomyces sp. SPB4]
MSATSLHPRVEQAVELYGQATWATLRALLLVALPRSERTVLQVLFRPARVPNLLGITHDRDKV